MPAALRRTFLPNNGHARLPIGGALWNRQVAVTRTLCMAAVALAILAGPARAIDVSNNSKDPLQLKYEREDNERKENERQYNEQMKRLKKQMPTTTKSDPWATMRSTDSSKH
jgi:hypothetical protein